MSRLRFIAIAMLVSAGSLVARGGPVVQNEQWSRADLNKTLQQMGYETKSLGDEETSSYTFETGASWKIYLSAQVSASKKYVWILVNLGDVTETTKFQQLLKANSSIQPSHFYINSTDKLYCGVPLENRELNPVRLKTGIDMIIKSITDTQDAWAKTP